MIRKKDVADSITLYDTKLQQLAGIVKSYDEITTQMINEGNGIFDNQYMRHNFQSESISLLTNNTATIRRYANTISIVQVVGGYYSHFLLRQKELAITLIALIKKEYHFK